MARKAINTKNLKPFKKGISGNPAGRPVKLPDIDGIIAKVLNERCNNNITRAENIFRKMAIKAESDVRAAEMVFERAYGRIKQTADIEIDFKQFTEAQLDQIINRLITTNHDKETEGSQPE